jgi:hypothetical protein
MCFWKSVSLKNVKQGRGYVACLRVIFLKKILTIQIKGQNGIEMLFWVGEEEGVEILVFNPYFHNF